jgi:hypothetical protein
MCRAARQTLDWNFTWAMNNHTPWLIKRLIDTGVGLKDTHTHTNTHTHKFLWKLVDNNNKHVSRANKVKFRQLGGGGNMGWGGGEELGRLVWLGSGKEIKKQVRRNGQSNKDSLLLSQTYFGVNQSSPHPPLFLYNRPLNNTPLLWRNFFLLGSNGL